MCAIFGGIGIKNVEILNKMSESMLYRGPDKFDFYKEKKLFLANNRLSIIDVKNGNQPFFSADKKYVVVLNGTIFNFREIKRYLEKKNIKFKSDSDTEVLVNSYMYWGKKCFNFFDGMWAAAIYDRKKNELVLSRDYIGQKPLYYFYENKRFIFSSEIKGILQNNVPKDLNRKSLREFFIYSHIPEPKTLFSKIFQVEAGQNISLNCGSFKLTKKKYWDLYNGPKFNKFFLKKDENLKLIFNKKLNNYKISDHKPSFFLSSGIDSNLVAKILDKKERLKKYNLSFDSKTFDESRILKGYKIKNLKYFKLSKKEAEKNFFSLIKYLDDPIGDSSILPTYSLFKHVKTRKEKLVIGGDGGDESFFGYIIFDALYLAKIIKFIVPDLILKMIKKLTSNLVENKNYMSITFKIKKFFDGLNHDLINLPDMWMSSLNEEEFKNYFKNKHNDEIKNFFVKKKLSKNNYLDMTQIYFFKFYLPNILKKIDRGSMYNSIEYRAPLLSKYIINYGIGKKNCYKFLDKKSKLKEIARDILDKKIINSKKHGFALPKELIIDNKKVINGVKKKYLYNPEFFYYKLDQYYKNKNFNSSYLWNEIILNYTLQNIYEEY